MSEPISATSTQPASRLTEFSTAVTRGSVGGLVAGTVFILANMFFAAAHGKPPIAPLLSVSTIFTGAAMPQMTPALALTGLVVHLLLSAIYGVVFALVVAPFSRDGWWLVLSGLIFGVVLYLVDFQIGGRLFFPFFTNPNGPNPVFELIIHPIAYGLVLVPFFLGTAGRLWRRRA